MDYSGRIAPGGGQRGGQGRAVPGIPRQYPECATWPPAKSTHGGTLPRAAEIVCAYHKYTIRYRHGYVGGGRRAARGFCPTLASSAVAPSPRPLGEIWRCPFVCPGIAGGYTLAPRSAALSQ